MTELLGIDLGAGSLKATVIDAMGSVLATGSADVKTQRPHIGWSEQNPDDWDAAMRSALAQIAASHGLAGISGISFTAGAHTAVLMDGEGRVLRPAILWNDQRSGVEAAELNARMEARLLQVGHNRAAATWTLPQLAWVMKHEPAIAARTKRILIAKDWLRSRLTGDFLTDRIDAEGTLLAEAGRDRWSEELCQAINWPMETLPEIRNPSDIAGHVTKAAAERYGLAPGTPVVVGTSDTAAETWAAGAITPGYGVIKLATAGTISIMAAAPHPCREMINYGHVVPNHNYLINGTNSCASAHRWLRDILVGPNAVSADFTALDQQAAAIAPGSDGLIFHPYLEGERSPYWDTKLRADFLGLTMRHTRGHMVRALYEGITFSIKDCSQNFTAVGHQFTEVSLIGGGSRSPVWSQIVADVMGIPVKVPQEGDASFGAALLAGVGIGTFADEKDAVRRCVRYKGTLLPIAANIPVYQARFERYRRTKDLLTEVYHNMAED